VAENSKIEWTDATFNPWRGCTKVSAGCAHCYAETLSGRNPKVLGVWGPNGTRVVAAESAWKEPVKWNRLAAEGRLPDGTPNQDGHRPRVFCASLADVFEDWHGPMSASNGGVLARPYLDAENRWENWSTTDAGSLRTDPQGWKPVAMNDVRARLFRVIHETPNLDWLLVTKRPENVSRHLTRYAERIDTYVAEAFSKVWGRRVWLGTSVENQAAADERIPHLLRAPAAARFLSCEPLLGPVDLRPKAPDAYAHLGRFYHSGTFDPTGMGPAADRVLNCFPKIDWVIVGGESGPGARLCNVEWVRSIVAQCRDAGVSVFVKQLGANVVDECEDCTPEATGWPAENSPINWDTGSVSLRDKKGGDSSEWPKSLRVREFPTPAEG
jgi:protein gp37